MVLLFFLRKTQIEEASNKMTKPTSTSSGDFVTINLKSFGPPSMSRWAFLCFYDKIE